MPEPEPEPEPELPAPETATPTPAAAERGDGERRVAEPPAPDRRPRPLIERIGMAAIALVLGTLFGTIAVAAFVSGELFLATMGAIGCVMTFWVGGLTLFRG